LFRVSSDSGALNRVRHRKLSKYLICTPLGYVTACPGALP